MVVGPVDKLVVNVGTVIFRLFSEARTVEAPQTVNIVAVVFLGVFSSQT